jgi:hypothetical protein
MPQFLIGICWSGALIASDFELVPMVKTSTPAMPAHATVQ